MWMRCANWSLPAPASESFRVTSLKAIRVSCASQMRIRSIFHTHGCCITRNFVTCNASERLPIISSVRFDGYVPRSKAN